MKEEYKTIWTEIKTSNPTILDTIINDKARLRFQGNYVRKFSVTPQKKKRGQMLDFEGFFYGDTLAYDRNESKKQKILNALKEDPGKFLEFKLAGKIDEKNTPLDDRAKVFGKRNENHGKPWKEEWRRKLYGFFKYNSSWSFGVLNLQDDFAKGMPLDTFIPYKFKAIDRGIERGYLTINQSTTPDFKFEQIEPKDWNIEDIVKKHADITPWEKLDEKYERTKDAWDRYVFFEGIVKNIYDKSIPDKVIINLYKEGTEQWSKDISCFSPNGLTIGFGEDSRVLVLAKLMKNKDGLYCTGYGYYPLPGYVQERKAIPPVKQISIEEMKGRVVRLPPKPAPTVVPSVSTIPPEKKA